MCVCVCVQQLLSGNKLLVSNKLRVIHRVLNRSKTPVERKVYSNSVVVTLDVEDGIILCYIVLERQLKRLSKDRKAIKIQSV